jgi:hypothetical protein
LVGAIGVWRWREVLGRLRIASATEAETRRLDAPGCDALVEGGSLVVATRLIAELDNRAEDPNAVHIPTPLEIDASPPPDPVPAPTADPEPEPVTERAPTRAETSSPDPGHRVGGERG